MGGACVRAAALFRLALDLLLLLLLPPLGPACLFNPASYITGQAGGWLARWKRVGAC